MIRQFAISTVVLLCATVFVGCPIDPDLGGQSFDRPIYLDVPDEAADAVRAGSGSARYYSFDATAEERIYIYTESSAPLDVTLYNELGERIGTSVDSSFSKASLYVDPDEDTTYVIQITAKNASSDIIDYTLVLDDGNADDHGDIEFFATVLESGALPVDGVVDGDPDTDVDKFRFSGSGMKLYEIVITADDVLSAHIESNVGEGDHTLQAGETHRERVVGSYGTYAWVSITSSVNAQYTIAVEQYSVYPYVPDIDPTEDEPFALAFVPALVAGYIDYELGNESDFYTFEAVAGKTYTVEVIGEWLDSLMTITGEFGDSYEDDDSGQSGGSLITFTATQAAQYTIGLRGYSDGDYGSYFLLIQET